MPEHAEASVDKKKIISVPMRFVRTKRGIDDELQPKSWLILAGHADLAIGLYRTDPPTTSHLSVLIATVVAGSYGWTGFFLFDVQTAFLSGLAMERELYTCTSRGPAGDWRRSTRQTSAEFLQILKGAHGLTEAPRLLHLKAPGSLQDIGGEELMMAKATFVFRVVEQLVAIFNLHVDRGLLYGYPDDHRFKKVKEQVNSHFNVKVWKTIHEEDEKYPGKWEDNKGRYLYPHGRVHQQSPAHWQWQEGRPGQKPGYGGAGYVQELAMYRSTLAKARWPVNRVVLELAYGVSVLAQHNTNKVGEIKVTRRSWTSSSMELKRSGTKVVPGCSSKS